MQAEKEGFLCLRLGLGLGLGSNPNPNPNPNTNPNQAEREGFLCLSAGHAAHPATTAAATEHAFAFLRRAAAGAAAQANSELRG